jgi:DNA-binding NtrC family response regulator
VQIPPLRQRRQDIIALARYFLDKFSASEKCELKLLSAEAESLLIEHSWLGNVRELENTIFRIVVLSENAIISVDDIKNSLNITNISAPVPANATSISTAPASSGISIKTAAGEFKSLVEINNEVIDAVLQNFDGNVAKAAKALSVAKSTIYRKFS